MRTLDHSRNAKVKEIGSFFRSGFKKAKEEGTGGSQGSLLVRSEGWSGLKEGEKGHTSNQ